MRTIAAALVASIALSPLTGAFAASVDEHVALCAAALDANGSAKADEYRAKFHRMSGASVTTLTLRLTPIAGGEAKTAQCKIKRGEVVEAVVQA
jgi:hypothetical protein